MHRVAAKAKIPDSATRITTGFIVSSYCDRLNGSRPASWTPGLSIQPFAGHVAFLNCKHIIWISCHVVIRREEGAEFHAPKSMDPRTPLDQEVSCLPWSAKPQLQFG